MNYAAGARGHRDRGSLETGVSQPCRATLDVIRRALESAGVEFIDENGGGPGVRLRKRQVGKGIFDALITCNPRRIAYTPR